MPLRDLAPWLLDTPGFVERLERVIIEATSAELPEGAVGETAAMSEPHDWSYLLFAASLLATADDDTPRGAAARDAALRIAQHCLSRPRAASGGVADNLFATSGLPSEDQRAAAATVLDALANRPALALAMRREMLQRDVERQLPIPARIEWLRRHLENAVDLSDDSPLSVNRFQRRFWSEVEQNDWLSFSAPTSAGKSFIVTQWVIEFARRHPTATVVYLVPTRALISQVEAELRRLATAGRLEHVVVASLPLARSVVAGRANLLVLTQERLHILLTAVPDLAVDVLIVDEAHKVGDGHRGVLLQQVVERVTATRTGAKVIFASPMTSNPQVLVQDAPAPAVRDSFASNEITVAQNLIWASQLPLQPRRWAVSLCLPDRRVRLGVVRLASTPSGGPKRLAYVAHAIGAERAGNVVYVNGAADAEKVALLLYDLRGPEGDVRDNPEVRALIELSEKTVHREFALGVTLGRGIAFHYGNLPLLIRTEIERLFSEGVIHYLVCTSTLIEGVNMSCRSIFVRGPTKGRGHPMSAEDFWNLAGRAGRWGREFQGSVVCIDAEDEEVWGVERAPRERRRYAIKRTADTVVGRPHDLLAFVRAGTPRDTARRHPDLEFVFSYLMSQHLRRGTIRSLPWVERLDSAAVALVEEAVAEAAAGLRTPADVVERNPGISPLAMDSLLERFGRPGRDPTTLLPADPASEDAVDVYRAIFARIAGHLNAALGPAGRRSHALALLVTRWMRGYPLARLIEDRIRFERRPERAAARGRVAPPGTAAIIRAVLGDVENIARFEAPRSLTCYVDLLRVYLEQVGRPELAADLPELGVMLEFGVPHGTQVSLIALGLSRTSAVLLGEIMTRDNLTEEGALAWLAEGPWRVADLPALVKAEIERLLVLRLRASA